MKQIFNSLLQKYATKLEEAMKGSEFVFDSVDLLYYKFHKRSLNYGAAVGLNLKQVKIHPERISNIKPFISQYSSKWINFPSHKKDWKKFETNDKK